MKTHKAAQKSELNLARKWRSQNFDRIIGQDLSVRILKNSLYKAHYFPVYLFSGQRGCGKTTTARVFASALNCDQLSAFQKNPQSVQIPCLSCRSCQAMSEGRHPDFIEIDAASHTGVDNMRSLIENASLLPLLGSKKIYLIDEVHMLSKAAFNALLKILEEPPSQVIFILATTDPQKIIDTVVSRCFQLFFRPIAPKALHKHLAMVCDQESIACTADGIASIIEQSEGSARDALNLLEQVRFASSTVTKESVLKVLGYLDDQHIIAITVALVDRDTVKLLELFNAISFATCNPHYVWKRLVDFIRTIMWFKFGVKPDLFQMHHDIAKKIAAQCSVGRLKVMLQYFFENEQLFLKTRNQHSLLEMILLQLAAGSSEGSSSGGAPLPATPTYGAYKAADEEGCEDVDGDLEEDEEEEIEDDALNRQWASFVKEVEMLNDPLLHSIFQQGKPLHADKKEQKIVVEFAENQQFFKKWIQETVAIWQHLLEDMVGARAIEPRFSGPVIEKPKPASVADSAPVHQAAHKSSYAPKQAAMYPKKSYGSSTPKTQKLVSGTIVDISDAQKWKKAHLILQYFPGTVTQLSEKA